MTCPNCGFDFKALDRVALGDLVIDAWGAKTFWKGVEVPLDTSLRLALLAIVRGGGNVVTAYAITQAMGYEGDRSMQYAGVVVHKLRKAFRKADPGFDMIETRWGAGLRWRTELIKSDT